ncbi:dihydroxyacetone kinase subunit DhaK [Pseudonocardia sp. ICBG1293]|uniref:dihydroxyacetone kinase subunit DhaK n=1 Tax=Pseudonocardia sp. ICBG1293 TaxID=2844382 RepID=UPI001CCA45DF|nr:dihydroxyacetone kinase subunit DhaK [Pseudonocardia sp. ICBG1293]
MPFPFHPAGDDPVPAAVRGFARAHADLVTLHEDPIHLVARHRAPGRRVGLVSGGGSGHEPLHAGFLGRGMLDAVAPGPVFTSPHNKAVLHASRAAAGPEGVVHIVKNYTGDRINFGIAAERLRMEGVDVARVLVDDDLATDGLDTATGRRGTGATVVVEKILGAAADGGAGLTEVATLGAEVAAASRSLAVASRAQSSARTGEPAFALDGQLDYGVGIHGERARRSIDRPSTEDLVERMVGEIVDGLPAPAPSGDAGVVLVVNGMGGTALLELYVLAELASAALERRGLDRAGLLVGTFVPALDMAGFSLTLTRMRPAWTSLWSAPAQTAAFPRTETS